MSRIIVLSFLLAASIYFTYAAPGPSHTPVDVSVEALASQPEITPKEAKQLRKEFKKAQKSELRALDASHKRLVAESKAARKQRLKDWESEERTKRRKFFTENGQGSKRREFVKDFIERRKALQSALKEEEKTERQEFDSRRKSLLTEQDARRGEMEMFLKGLKKPPEALWPR